jgi:hypothetical protein
VLGATVCLGVAGTGIAFGYWNSTDSSNPAHALANSLPQGATPSASVTPANSNTVVITFAEVATTSGAVEIPAADYILKSYPAGGSSPTTVTGSCSGTGTITCTVSSVPDGSWQYTDTPTYATNWVGIESARSNIVTVNVPPTVVITYPVNGTEYGADWTGTITGTATAAAGTAISGVQVSIKDTKTDKWWNGTGFSSGTQTFVAATGDSTWFLTFPASDLTPCDTYSVIGQATDSEGNVGTSSTVTFSYCVHTRLPVVAITYPVNNTTYGTDWTGTITGSAWPGEGASITSTELAIEETTTGLWWNGTGFSAGTKMFVPVMGTTTWYLGFAATNLTSANSYALVAEATDSNGNTGTSSTVSFTYSPLPTVTITFPCNCTTYNFSTWTGEITGTATAGPGTSISGVQVAVEDTTTGEWWNDTGFSASTQSFVAATGKTTWYRPLDASYLTSGDNYSVIAEATDSAGNTGTSSTVAFSYYNRNSKVPPTVVISYPVNNTTYGTNWTGTITGTASSNAGAGTTITGVAVAVEDMASNKWWNGTGFSDGTEDFVTADGNTTWMFALAADDLTSGVTYSVVAQAQDSRGNQGTSSTVDFTYSIPTPPPPPTTPPSVTITYPVNGTTYGVDWTGTITGTASSSSEIKSAAVAVEDTTSKQWWTGTSFSSSSQTFVTASGTTSWSLGLAVGKLTSDNSYAVIAQATDNLNNVGTSSTVDFSYNATPPTVWITYPVNGASYDASIFSWRGTIAGTATDALDGVTSVKVSVHQGSGTSTCWTGSGHSFTASCPNYLPVTTGTTKWSLSLPAADLSNGSYKVTAEATDTLGNIATSPTVAFTYDTTPPRVFNVLPRYMGDCGDECSTGIYWTITGSNFLPGATVSFPSTGPSADFSVVTGSVKVIDSTTIVLLVKDTGTITGKATVVVTDPGESPAFGSITATGKPDPTSLSIIGPSTVGQGTHTTLRLKVTGMSCSNWGPLVVFFSNPGIAGGTATCSGGIVSVPITVSSNALLGNSSVTLLAEGKDFAISTNGLSVEVPRG